MTELGLRERKKVRTRRVIADAAARLFAERGYEQVAVQRCGARGRGLRTDRLQLLSEQEHLVTDYDQEVQDQLSRLIRTRAPGTTPAAAIREFALDVVEGSAAFRPSSGVVSSYLAAISPAVHRLALRCQTVSRCHRHRNQRDGSSHAGAGPAAGDRASPACSKSSSARPGAHDRGPEPGPDADELQPAIEVVLDDLDRWLTPATK